MTASEFAFLSLGLLLGVLSGAALMEVLRSRPPSPREVRLTVTPGSVPRRRLTTLAEDAFVLPGPEPAHAGPGDRRLADRAAGTHREIGTDVRSSQRAVDAVGGGSLPSGRRPGPGASAAALPAPVPGASAVLRPGTAGAGIGGGIAVPIHREADWTLQALRTAAARVAERAMTEQRVTVAAVLDPPEHVAAERVTSTSSAAARSGAGSGAGSGAAAAEPPATPVAPVVEVSGDAGAASDCTGLRRIADERCAVADRARDQARVAADALREAQRAYDDHHTRAEEAAVAADARSIRAAKEHAQQAFREARAAATTAEAIEAAARDWLTEINRINVVGRDAASTVAKERDAANALVMTIERLTVEADAARISAEAAAAACVASRQAVADCEESAVTREVAPGWPTQPSVEPGSDASGPWEEETELEAAFAAGGEGEPAILRLLRGDRATLGRLVAELGGDDPSERRRWQLSLAGLVDAIVARSIEASALTFPLDHPFWGAFTLHQNRDIVAALSSLGYRFDGLGGWSDGRVPGQRDLSLAVGYAGLDPMRVRPWPSDDEMAELFADVAVAADEYLADAAGGMTLGELVSLLGRRADQLADLWNEWGRVRPLLLAGA